MSAETAPTLCFVDVESTGLDSRRHDVWEIAIIRRTHVAPDEEYVFQLTPDSDPEWADEEALKISRFAERFLIPADARYDAVRVENGKPTERMHQTEVWMEVQDLLRGTHMVGAVPSFDAAMLTAMLQRVAFKTTWHHRLICVETMAATVLGWPVPQGLGKSAEALGLNVDPDTAHTALGDARLALAVYDAVQGRHTGSAAQLRRAADGRAHYAANCPNAMERIYLENEAETFRKAARVVEGEPGLMCGLLPTLMWGPAEDAFVEGESR